MANFLEINEALYKFYLLFRNQNYPVINYFYPLNNPSLVGFTHHYRKIRKIKFELTLKNVQNYGQKNYHNLK